MCIRIEWHYPNNLYFFINFILFSILIVANPSITTAQGNFLNDLLIYIVKNILNTQIYYFLLSYFFVLDFFRIFRVGIYVSVWNYKFICLHYHTNSYTVYFQVFFTYFLRVSCLNYFFFLCSVIISSMSQSVIFVFMFLSFALSILVFSHP